MKVISILTWIGIGCSLCFWLFIQFLNYEAVQHGMEPLPQTTIHLPSLAGIANFGFCAIILAVAGLVCLLPYILIGFVAKATTTNIAKNMGLDEKQAKMAGNIVAVAAMNAYRKGKK